jgi:hypothetical protein
MLNLLLAAGFTAGLFICFRLFGRFHVPVFQAIIINYFTCVLIGLIVSGGGFHKVNDFFHTPYLYFTMGLGLLFVSTFYLVGYTARYVSVTLSSVANKMSMVIPMIAAVWIADIPTGALDLFQWLGLLLSLLSIVFSSINPQGNSQDPLVSSWKMALLPVAVFIMSGLVDTGINLGNYLYLKEGDKNGFIISVFFFAGTAGLIAALIGKLPWSWKAIAGGISLGTVNYFSLILLLKALDDFNNDAVFVFPALNILTILIAGTVSVFAFGEQLGRYRRWALFLSFAAILLLSYKEWFRLLLG